MKNAINNDPTLVKTIFTEEPELLTKVLDALGGIQGAIAALAATESGSPLPKGVKFGPFGPDFFAGTVHHLV